MPQADVHHAASRHSALTTSLTSTRARRNPLLTSHPRPQQQEQESTRLAAKFAGAERNPWEGLARCETARNSSEDTHAFAARTDARIRRQKEAHLLVLVGEPVHTDFVTRNSHGKRFHSR